MLNRIITVTVYLLLVYQCDAQGVVSEHIDVASHRSGNNVLTFFEDSRGFVWCGTMEDLVRYDGFSVKKYSYKDGGEEIRIESIVEDNKGNIWCASQKYGLMFLPLNKNGFGSITRSTYNKLVSKPTQIAFDDKGNLWGIDQNQELFTINRANLSVYKWPTEKTGKLNFLGFTTTGSLWISGIKGAFYINDPAKRNIQQVMDLNIRKTIIDSNTVYFYTQNNIYKIEDNNGKRPLCLLANTTIKSANSGAKHLIAVTTNQLTPFLITAVFNQPLLLTDKNLGTSVLYPFAGNSTLKYEIHSCYFSSTAKLYIGTNQGFFKVSFGNKAFKTYTDTNVKLRCVTSISNDTLLLGTQGWGILRYIRNNGQWIKDKNKEIVLTKNPLGYTINRFYKDKKNRLWAATNGGLCYRDNNIWKFAYSSSNMWGITQDSSGIFWLGSNGSGLIKFDPVLKTSKTFSVQEQSEFKTDVNYNRVWTTKFYNKKVYLGTGSGLVEFDPKTSQFSELFGKHFRGVSVWDFFISDTLWLIPTQGKGIWIYKPQNNTFKQVSTAQSAYYSLQCSGQNSIWVIGDKGILLNPQMGDKSLSFNADDGLNTNYFSFTGIGGIGQEEVALCGEDGFTIANVSMLSYNDSKATEKLFISSLKYAGISIADFLPTGSTVELDYKNGQLLLEWAGANFQPNKNQLHYKLNGVDENWNTAGPDNKINYTNLLHGTYTFTAYIAGQQHAYQLKIKINPPFWLTAWFKATTSGIVLLLLIYFIYNWVGRQKLKHAQLKSEIDALRAQMNPHFVFNVLNSIQSYIYNEKISEANEYLTKFANLMRKILQNSREEVITLSQELLFLEQYLEMEALRFKGNLNYKITLTENCNAEILKIPSMLLQPLVENALKHANNDDSNFLQVQITFSVANGILICEVADNGKGFLWQTDKTNTETKKSLGLTIVKERLFTLSKIYGKEYRLIFGNNDTGTGTVIKLIIPQND